MNEIDINKDKLLFSLYNKGISESVLNSIAKVKRELFLPETLKEMAYQDCALPIECEQTISQPYTVAYMTELLDVEKVHKVLEIGTGSGYQTAVLWNLSEKIYTIERIEYLLINAINRLNLMNIYPKYKLDDGAKGWESEAPFDRILVTARAEKVPSNLLEQLKNGGKMVLPLGGNDFQYMTIIEKYENNELKISKKEKFKFVPLITDKYD